MSVLETVDDGRHVRVVLSGEIDLATSPALRDGLLGLVNRGCPSLVVDMTDVTFLDSSGVGTLLRVLHRQHVMGGAMHLVVRAGPVLRVLQLMQLTRRLHVVPRVADIALCCGPLADGGDGRDGRDVADAAEIADLTDLTAAGGGSPQVPRIQPPRSPLGLVDPAVPTT